MELKNKYQNGKIYIIKSPNTDKVYIGSTTEKYLSRRLAKHIHHTGSNVTAKIIIDAGDAYIELVELFPCNSKYELNKREGEMQKLQLNKVNKYQAGRTALEREKEYRKTEKYKQWSKQYKKEYYEKNKEIINVKSGCPHCNIIIQKKSLKRHINNMHK